MTDKIIQRAVSKLERDAILPFQTLQPTLVVIHKPADQDDGAQSYLNNIKRIGEQYSVSVKDYDAATPFLAAELIKEVSKDPCVHGILITSDYGEVNRTLYNRIPVSLDIDSLSTFSVGTLIGNNSPIAYRHAPCTAAACMKIIEALEEKDDFSGKTCLIVGRSMRVGRPLAEILTQKNMTVALAHSKSDLGVFSYSQWDYIVSAIGRPNYWGYEHQLPVHHTKPIRIIDVGMNVDENGKLCGDVDRKWFNELPPLDRDNYITPVIGGVGRMTTTVLFSKLFANATEYFKSSTGTLYIPTSGEYQNIAEGLA